MLAALAGVHPKRASPVSISRWMSAVRPNLAAASLMARAVSTSSTVTLSE